MTVRAAFAGQARACRMLGSELTALVCEGLGAALQPDQGQVATRILNWSGDPAPSADSVPLRVAGALHMLVRSGRVPDLAAAYAQGKAQADLMIAALQDHEDIVLDWMRSPPQTNEVARSAAIIAAAHFLRPALPLAVLELGASAGLNLNWHRFRLAPHTGQAGPGYGPSASGVVLRPDWHGALPAPTTITVATSEGVDLNPLDAVRDGERLLAYCWPDQRQRLKRLQAALTIARAHPPQLSAGDAADWLEQRLARPAPGQMRFLYHTIAWQYFPPATQARAEAAIQAAAATASADAPLAHVSMEADGDRGAALRLRLWDGAAHDWQLGRADFHGRWIDWAPA